MRVMTWNIRYDAPGDGRYAWAGRWPSVQRYFQGNAPDVLALQEVLPHQWNDLRGLFPDHESLGHGRDADRGGEHCLLFFRRERFVRQDGGTFWLSPTPDRPSRGWDACLPRICTWAQVCDRQSGLTFSIYNVHLDHIGEKARRHGLALVMQRLQGKPAILLGDFNAEIGDFPADGLRDSHGPELGGTYHEWDGRLDGPRIDYILTTPPLHARDGGRILPLEPGHFLSDHYPVWADLE